MKKVLIATFSVLLLLTGCKQVPKLENGKEAVVTSDKGKISVDDLYDEMKNQYALSILLDMIDTKILNEKYEDTDEQKEYIKAQKDNDKAYYEVFYSGSYSSYDTYLRDRYRVNNEEDLDEVFKLNFKRSKAVEDYAKTLVSESEIKDYYEDDYIAEMEASHILITAEYDANATEEEKAKAEKEAENKAKEIIKKLDNGENFAELAKQYSKDGSAENGGAIGQKFGHGKMVPEFESAAVKLKVGEYTKEPVKTKFGYHIILKTKEYDKKPLEEAKEEIIESLANEKISKDSNISYKALIKLRDDNNVTIEDTALKEQYENFKYQYE